MDEMQEWIDDALDLIEFANGDRYTKWGRIRANMGHIEPFNLEYIAIGNEEVGEAFFERYPYSTRQLRRSTLILRLSIQQVLLQRAVNMREAGNPQGRIILILLMNITTCHQNGLLPTITAMMILRKTSQRYS